MVLIFRLTIALAGGTLVALLYAAAVLRVLPAAPRDAMSAAGMALMLAWPALVVAAFVPLRCRTSLALLGANAAIALLIGWGLP